MKKIFFATFILLSNLLSAQTQLQKLEQLVGDVINRNLDEVYCSSKRAFSSKQFFTMTSIDITEVNESNGILIIQGSCVFETHGVGKCIITYPIRAKVKKVLDSYKPIIIQKFDSDYNKTAWKTFFCPGNDCTF